MPDKRWDVMIVGGGIAGFSAAAAVLARGGSRSLMLLSEEDRIPYRRTKISKRLAEGFSVNELALQPEQWYRQRAAEVRVNSRAVAIDPGNRVCTLADGSAHFWNSLILATGAAAVVPNLPGFATGLSQGRVFCLRTARDAERLRAAAADGKSALIVGAGVLGIEIAEQLHRLGLRVTIVEKMNRAMPADLDEEASAILADLLRGQGIDLHLSSCVRDLNVDRPEAVAVELSDRRLEAEIVVFCLGALPRIDLAAKAGLVVQRGVSVDNHLRTSHPRVYAAGDAAMHTDGRITHLWHAAEHQGEVAGANACGERLQYLNLPFRLKMEIFGHYFFSMSWPWNGAGMEGRAARRKTGSLYQSLRFQDGRLSGVVMIDDKPRAELYKQAVLERQAEEQVERSLSL